MTETKQRPLIARLLELSKRQDRGKLAALRAGLGKKPGQAPAMWPIMAEFLPESNPPLADAMFIVAALFGAHPNHSNAARSFGNSLRMCDPAHAESGLERRMIALLDADPEDVQRHLEAVLSYCERANKPVNYDRLIYDLAQLLSPPSDERDRVRQRWAQDFWRKPKAAEVDDDNEPETEDPTE